MAGVVVARWGWRLLVRRQPAYHLPPSMTEPWNFLLHFSKIVVVRQSPGVEHGRPKNRGPTALSVKAPQLLPSDAGALSSSRLPGPVMSPSSPTDPITSPSLTSPRGPIWRAICFID